MNKSVLVAAVLSTFAVAVSAQTSVTLFGVVDLNVSNFKAGNNIAGGALNTKLVDGTNNGGSGSRWGIRANEDLGGGTKVGAVLESGFAPDTGAMNQGGRLFGRQSYLSLASTNIGELRLGRQYTLDDETQPLSNPFGSTLVLNPSMPLTTSVTGRLLQMFIDAPRLDNIIQYRSPTIGGASVQLSFAPGEGINDNYLGLRASYLAGPVQAALSYERNKDRLTGANTNKLLEIAANYDFGAFKLLGGYQRSMDLTTNTGNVSQLTSWTLPATDIPSFAATGLKGYTFGASMPFGQVLAGVNYTRTNYEGAAGQHRSLGKFGIGAKYALSKSTFLYTGLSIATGELKNYILEKRVVQLGLNKSF